MKNAVLTSKVEGTCAIIWIVPEGTAVKVGDLVCELDSSLLSDKETQQEILAERAQTAYDQGVEDLKIQEIQNKSETEAAALKLQLAEIDLRKYQEGDLVQQKEELLNQSNLAEENLSRALESYDYVKRLAKIGYRTQNDLESERIAVETQKINKALFEGKRKVLAEFTENRTLVELSAKVDECRREIQRTESRTKSASIQKQAELHARQLVLEVEKNKHKRLQDQIAACKILANQDGQVVYANTRDGRATEQIMIDVGVLVRERQAIINLPDLDHMKVNARIHESRINMVRQGMTAQVKVDAEPTYVFNGIVDQVASVPSSTGGFGNTAKEYEAVVKIVDASEKVNRLRPGLNASTEILVERREDVLQIPIQANVTIGTKQFAFVVVGKKIEQRTLKVGKNNSNFIEVLEGVAEGEEVVLNPRHQFEKQIAEIEAAQANEQSKEKETTKAPSVEAPAIPPKTAAPAQQPAPDASSEKSAEGGVARADRGSGRGRSNGEGSPEGGRPPGGGGDPMERFNRMDKDQDGKVTKSEAEGNRLAERFDMVDADQDGNVTKEEYLSAMSRMRAGGGSRPAEAGGN